MKTSGSGSSPLTLCRTGRNSHLALVRCAMTWQEIIDSNLEHLDTIG
jgi:hypothetical protein